jgi:hypothetical protein
VLWIYAAVSKLSNYPAFLSQLQRQPLPAWSVPTISIALQMVEELAVLLLSFQRTMSKGLFLSFILLLLFTIYVGLGLMHVYDKVPCSCGGILNNMGWTAHLVFNLAFTLLAFSGWLLSKRIDATNNSI